jgi:hypothetical protein
VLRCGMAVFGIMILPTSLGTQTKAICCCLALLLVGCASSALNQTPTGEQPNTTQEEVIHTQITVIVTDSAARVLYGTDPATAESKELLQVTESLDVTIQPMHPGVTDPTMMAYFIIDAPDMETAERVLTQIQQLKAVVGAYIKPPDELP